MRTLIRTLESYAAAEVALAAPYRMRRCTPGDAATIGRLHHEIYGIETLSSTVAEFEGSFRGEYGEPIEAASSAIEHAGGLVAATLTVQRAPWEGIPSCPYVNDLLTDPEHRRRGLARAMLLAALNALADRGSEAVALRVDEANQPALALYGSLGFVDWGRAPIAPTAGDQ